MVGATKTTEEAVDLARHAEAVGADGISSGLCTSSSCWLNFSKAFCCVDVLEIFIQCKRSHCTVVPLDNPGKLDAAVKYVSKADLALHFWSTCSKVVGRTSLLP